MCGFIGVIGGRFDANRALPWLRRRGPDSQNTWTAANASVSLLHCRLSIVDDDARSDQPFCDPTHGIVVALNGEIYNYRDLQRRYADFPFRTESDTEVIVAAYVKEGIEGFKRLNGMFAFVLVDERRGRIVLVRDAVGKKPLFCFSTGGALVFGSSLLPLIACSGVEPSIDATAAAFYWRRSYISPDTTAIEGVRPVLPGTALEFDNEGRQLASVRIEAAAPFIYGGESATDIKQTVRNLLVQAIDRRLENNPHPMGLLSGGVDSTVVTQIATERLSRREAKRPFKVITLGAMIPRTQDEYYARYAAKRLGLHLEIVHPPRRRLVDAVLKAITVQDEPLGMPSYFFLFQLIEAAAPYGKVLLTGDGGDEVFLGYRLASDWSGRELAADDQSSLLRVGPGPSGWMASWARDVTGNTLLGHMFTKIDRASAEQGVEVRCPLLDLALMGYVRSLPPRLVGHPTSLKPLLKDQIAEWPRWFVERRKLGFAYNLRWHWALTRFDGLREAISQDAIEIFYDRIPRALRAPPKQWNSESIFRNFAAVWRLMVWSAFIDRLNEATRVSRGIAPDTRAEIRSKDRSAVGA